MVNLCNDRGRALSKPAFKQKIYTKLDPGEIRTLLLAPGKKNKPIVCELEVAPNTKTYQYEALSYVCGTAWSNESIKCNGVSFEIMENLYQALLHLRYEKAWRRVWADQLCINQAESHELMIQVRNMGSIYSAASRVVVWLGHPDARMTSAWELIRETSLSPSLVRSDFVGQGASPSSTPTKKTPLHKSPRFFRSPRSQSVGSSRSLRSSMSRSSLSSLSSSTSSLATSILSQSSRTSSTSSSYSTSSSRISKNRSISTSSSPSLKHALTIFQHPYFSRKWTFQEIILPRAAVFTCGDGEIAFSDLASWYFHYAGKLRTESLLYDSVGSFGGILELRCEIAKVREQFESDSELSLHMTNAMDTPMPRSREPPHFNIRLSRLLMWTRNRSSLKAEDTIYALLGLHPKFSTYLHDIKEEEGWLPLPELFLAAFKFCIDDEADLGVLSAAGLYNGNKNAIGKGKYEGWPSWLPDWRETLPLRPLVMTSNGSKITTSTSTLSSAAVATDSAIEASEYQAAGRTKPEWKIEEDTDDGRFTLTLKGFRVGVVVTREASWPNNYFIPDQTTQPILDEKIPVPAVHAQSLSNLLSINRGNFMEHEYSSRIVAEAVHRNEICHPMRTSAATCAGDWVVVLLGGPTLYVVRPTGRDSSEAMILDNDDVEYSVHRDGNSTHLDEVMSDHEHDHVHDHKHKDAQVESSQNILHADESRVLTCRFVGECAVTGLMDGILVRNEDDNDDDVDNVKNGYQQQRRKHLVNFKFF